MNVSREQFISFLNDNNLHDKSKPVAGDKISVMQYIENDKLVAYAKYEACPGSPCIVSYIVCDVNSEVTL